MKKGIFVFISVLIILAFSSLAFSQNHPIKLGTGLVLSSGAMGIGEIDNTFGIRAEALYNVEKQLGALADLTFYFPRETSNVQATVVGVNLNSHYSFYSEEKLSTYAMGGLNITMRSVNITEQGSSFDISDGTDIVLGINLGAGIEYDLDFSNVFGELQFTGIGGDADQLVMGGGLRFPIYRY